MHDLNQAGLFANSFTAQAITQTITGGSQDFVEGDDIGHLIVAAGNTAGTNPTMDCKVQESADGSTSWADITGAAITQLTGVTNPAVQAVQFQRSKRYLRTITTIGGTGSPNFYGSALLLMQKKYGGT